MLDDADERGEGGEAEEALAALEAAMLALAGEAMLSASTPLAAKAAAKAASRLRARLGKVASDALGGIRKALRRDLRGAFALDALDEAERAYGREVAAERASATVSGACKSAEEAHEEAAREVERMVRRMAGDCAGEYARALARARVLAEGGGGRDGIAYRDVMAREVSRLAQRGLVATSYVRRDGTVVNVPVDVGLRRALHAAGRQRRMGYALEVAGETSGLVEVSWTRNARKSHADWQGGVYRVRKAREGEDIDRYPDFRKACRVGDPVDGIGGYNCGHKVTAYRPGRRRVFSDPSEETGVSAEEAREAVSRQRRIENAIRKDKREREVLDALGLDTGDVNRRIRARQKRLREHIAANPEVCRRERHRESVYERARKRAGAYGGVHLDGAQRRRVERALP